MISDEIGKLKQKWLKKHKILGEFISNIFTREKKNGGLGIIINLRESNKHVLNDWHFQMTAFEFEVSH